MRDYIRWKMVLGYFAGIMCLAAFFQNDSAVVSAGETLTLSVATMCGDVQDHQPQNQGIVFSIATSRIYCYTLFDPVPEKTTIIHNWYKRDNLTTQVKLQLQQPRWTTYSAIQLRESDKGPWRVEITDMDGHILQVLRFSITD